MAELFNSLTVGDTLIKIIHPQLPQKCEIVNQQHHFIIDATNNPAVSRITTAH